MTNGEGGTGIGREIRRRRLACEMTVEDLSARSGLEPHWIRELESGVRDPSLSMILVLAKAFGIPPGDLFGPIPDFTDEAKDAARLFDESRRDRL